MVKMVEELSDKRYEYWLDALKGVAMIFVVAGHSGLPSQISEIIYYFHMPLFFFISGYLEKDKKKTFKDTMLKRAGRLIYPYFLWGVLIVVYNTIYYYRSTDNFGVGIAKRVIALLYGNYIFENNYAYIGTLWFLVASFCVSALFWKFHRSRSQLLYTVFIGLVGFGLTSVENKLRFRLPWCFDIALVAFVFAAVGYFFKKVFDNYCDKRNWIMSFVLGALGIISGFLNTKYMISKDYRLTRADMLYLNWGCVPLFLFAGIAISVALCMVSRLVFMRYRVLILEYIGKKSLTIMVIHLYIIQIFSHVINKMEIYAGAWIIFVGGALLISVLGSKMIDCVFPWINDYSLLKKLLSRKKEV